MEESQTSSKKRRRNSAEKLLAKQKDYTFSSEDLLTLNHWEPVSYTHLDVYKRQGIYCHWNIDEQGNRRSCSD